MKVLLPFCAAPFFFIQKPARMRLIGVVMVAIGLSACSSTPCQEAADDPESTQNVMAKDLAIPPNLLNPAVENKPFNDAVKPPVVTQP